MSARGGLLLILVCLGALVGGAFLAGTRAPRAPGPGPSAPPSPPRISGAPSPGGPAWSPSLPGASTGADPREDPADQPPDLDPRVASGEAPDAPEVDVSPPAGPEPLADFEGRLKSLLARGDKAAFAELLSRWRTGALSRAAELALDQALAEVPAAQREALITAAGRALLEPPPRAERRRALAALLAGSGSQLAARYLLEAADQPALAEDALAALGSIADPEVLPVYRAALAASPDSALRAAIARSLSQMDTPKARALEQSLEPAPR